MTPCGYLLVPEAIGRGQAPEKRGPIDGPKPEFDLEATESQASEADDPEPEFGPDATESQASEADGPEPEFGPDATRRGRTSEADGPEPELGGAWTDARA